MLKRFHILGLLAATLVSAASLTLIRSTGVVSQKATVAIDGFVNTVGGAPVGGVWVSLIRRTGEGIADPDLVAALGPSSTVRRVQSDHDGRFGLDLPAGSYDVRAHESGFQSFINLEPIVIDPNAKFPGIRVRLEPVASLSGQILGEETAAGGVVIAYPVGSGELLPKRGSILDRGFSVIGLEPGSYRVGVIVPGYVPASLPSVSLSAGDHVDDLALSLQRGRSISGRLVDPEGDRLPGIEVRAQLDSGDTGLGQTCVSNPDGTFTITGLVPGEYRVAIHDRRYARSSSKYVVGDVDFEGATLQLKQLGRITGELTGGCPDGAVVYAIPEGSDLTETEIAGDYWIQGRILDITSGAYEIEGIPEGAYYIIITAPGYLRTYFPGTPNSEDASLITTRDGETFRAEPFVLQAGSTLAGQIVQRGSVDPIPDAAVEIASLDRRETVAAITDAEGRFILSGIGAGRYLIRVRAGGYIAQFFPGVSRPEEATPLDVDGKRDKKRISLVLPIRDPADFNEDGLVDVSDLDRFVDQVKAGGETSNSVFDANQDGLTTVDDFLYVTDLVRAAGQMIDPPSILEWKSTDAEPGQIRASLRVAELVPSIGCLAILHYDTDLADFVRDDPGESLFKDGRSRVEEVGPGVLVVVNGSPDRDEREGDGELISLVFRPKEDEKSVRLRTDAVYALLVGGRMATPVLPDPIRLALPPETFYLKQNVPNPFNPETTISYELPEAVQVKLTIFNLVGQRVRALVDDFKTPGRYDARWEGKDDLGRDVGSGVYFYSLEAGSFSTTKRMLLIR